MSQPRSTRLTPLLLLLLLSAGACASVLGIEEIHEDPSLARSGSAGSSPGGSDSGSPGGSSSGGNQGHSGSASNGGTSNAGSDSGGTPGMAGMAGSGAAGEESGGAGGTPPLGDPTVTGHVIDFWGQDVPNLVVQVGDATVTTDEDGKFRVENVPATYDVSFVLHLSDIEDWGYVYQGLTRRDPTLQAQRALTAQSADYKITTLDVAPDPDAGGVVSVAWAGAGFSISRTTGAVGLEGETDWRGPTSTVPAAGHAIYWRRDAATGLPVDYFGYDSNAFVLRGGEEALIAFQLAGSPVPPKGIVQGNVTPATGADRENAAFVRYSSGAQIRVVRQNTSAPDVFNYVVPNIPDTSITLAAIETGLNSGAVSIIHKNRLALGGTATLAIPRAAAVNAPAPDATVTATTEFGFTPGSGSAKAYAAVFRASLSSPYNDRLYVVTTDTKIKLPKVVGGDFLHPATSYYWQVQSHGSYQTVDEMAGPGGFMDAFSYDQSTPAGPRTDDGEYTISAPSPFVTGP